MYETVTYFCLPNFGLLSEPFSRYVSIVWVFGVAYVEEHPYCGSCVAQVICASDSLGQIVVDKTASLVPSKP